MERARTWATGRQSAEFKGAAPAGLAHLYVPCKGGNEEAGAGAGGKSGHRPH
jgi:hypothetical protein